MLWIAISLPQLPLEAFLRGVSAATCSTEATGTPWVVADTHTVLVANDSALAHGVRPGLALSAAYALAHHLQVKKRDPGLEAATLTSLATWAGQFTPSLSFEGAAGLLLEVSGSLKLFEGIRSILARLRTGIAALGLTASIAVAPTARAAWWLARSGKETLITEPAGLRAKLGALSVDTLDWPAAATSMLAAIGVNTLGEVMALPRAGFARRFGQTLLTELDQALDRASEARRFFVPPERFHTRLELPAAVESAGALLFAAKRLLVELDGFLRGRASSVQGFQITLEHDDHPPTLVSFDLVTPVRDEAHFALLVRERLDRLDLVAPVCSIALTADQLIPLSGATLTLFDDPLTTSADLLAAGARLVERLRARLGTSAVHGLTMVADHRPEYVVRPVEPGGMRRTHTASPASHDLPPPRPLWLLARPQPLAEVDEQPQLRGRLALIAGPERIESGWWDGNDIRRDYFIAQDEDRTLLWIYRDNRAAGWFLHGLFA